MSMRSIPGMSPRLFLQIVSLEARKLMSYRADFWLYAVVSVTVHFGVQYYLWSSIYADRHGAAIGGRTLTDTLQYYMLVILFAKFVQSGDYWGDVMRDIYDGSLTRYLIYPVAFTPFKYAQRLGNAVPTLLQIGVFAALYHALFGWILPARPLWQCAGMTAVGLVAANFLLFLLQYALELISFWSDSTWSLIAMLKWITFILGGFMIPLDLYPDWARSILAWLPFQYLFYQPVQLMLGHIAPGEFCAGLGIMSLWMLALGGSAALLWRAGDRQYTGVGI